MDAEAQLCRCAALHSTVVEVSGVCSGKRSWIRACTKFVHCCVTCLFLQVPPRCCWHTPTAPKHASCRHARQRQPRPCSIRSTSHCRTTSRGLLAPLRHHTRAACRHQARHTYSRDCQQQCTGQLECRLPSCSIWCCWPAAVC